VTKIVRTCLNLPYCHGNLVEIWLLKYFFALYLQWTIQGRKFLRKSNFNEIIATIVVTEILIRLPVTNTGLNIHKLIIPLTFHCFTTCHAVVPKWICWTEVFGNMIPNTPSYSKLWTSCIVSFSCYFQIKLGPHFNMSHKKYVCALGFMLIK